MGVKRGEINQALYYKLAKPRAVAALEESPFFNKEHAKAWANHDPEAANALLDEMGLTERNAKGTRLLPDGRPMQIVIETAGERAEVEDTLELITDTWADLGIRLLVKPQDRDVLRNRAFAGQTMMVAWYGWNVGIPTANATPTDLAPLDQATFSWPKWGQYYQTKGAAGEAPDIKEVLDLMALFEKWRSSVDEEGRAQAWKEMLAIHADQIFSIGTVSRAPVPVVHNAALNNVPADGIYAWDPGGQLGVHRMDEFFFTDGRSE